MVRQRRRDIQLDWPKKTPYRHAVALSPAERAIRDRAIEAGRNLAGQKGRSLVTAAHSSPHDAAAVSGEQIDISPSSILKDWPIARHPGRGSRTSGCGVLQTIMRRSARLTRPCNRQVGPVSSTLGPSKEAEHHSPIPSHPWVRSRC